MTFDDLPDVASVTDAAFASLRSRDGRPVAAAAPNPGAADQDAPDR
jgi:hypothetical protein